MKKLLSISVIAALAVLPMAANATAADVDKQPSAIDMTAQGAETTASNATANAAPKYELVASHTNDSNVATAGYVKGAYNATIRAINKVSETVATDLSGKANVDLSNVTSGSVTTGLINNGAVNADKLATDSVTTAKIADGNVTTAKIADENVTLGKLSQSVQTSLGKADTALQQADLASYATRTGAAATAKNAVDNAIVTYDLSGLGVTTGAVTGTATASIDVMTTWGSDSVTMNGVTGSVDLTNTEAVTGLTGNEQNQTASISAGTVTYSAGE